jgi:hypothetical protein
MASLYEVDPDALQNLINVLNRYQQELDNYVSQLIAGYNAFDGSFLSPDKPQLEQKWGDIQASVKQYEVRLDEVFRGLVNLHRAVQAIEQVSF